MKILINLTLTDGDTILVNFNNVTHVVSEKNSSIIYTTRNEGYRIFSVIEKMETIYNLVNGTKML